MNHFISNRLPLAIISLLAVHSVAAADGNIDAAKSSLIATFRQEHVPVDAAFRRFSGRIVYDAMNAAAANVALDVETGSLDLSDESYNAEVRKKSWFDSAAFPNATFRSTAFKSHAPGRLDATGALTIKGKTLTVTIPINVSIVSGVTAFDGTLVISRKAFGIGDPAWNAVLDDQVGVRFHMVGSNHQ
jgi:polyisoprenoid-binding protein YceI